MTALHWAAERGDAELADMLVYAGANVGGGDAHRPVHAAAPRRAGGQRGRSSRRCSRPAPTSTRSRPRAASPPLHLAAASGNADVDQRCCSTPGADVNAQRSRVGTDAADLRGGAEPRRRRSRRCSRAAPTRTSRRKTIDIAQAQRARSRGAPSASARCSRRSSAKGRASRRRARCRRRSRRRASCCVSGKIPPPGAERAGRPRQRREQLQSRRDQPAGRDQGRHDGAAPRRAPGLHRRGRARCSTAAPTSIRSSAGDGTTPAADGGDQRPVRHGDAADRARRQSEPRRRRATASTPLWAAINTQWQPRTRFPQPQEMELQKATYLDVMQALLDKGAEPNARITSHPWYLVYTGCGNRNCGLADTSGSTAFWRAAYWHRRRRR